MGGDISKVKAQKYSSNINYHFYYKKRKYNKEQESFLFTNVIFAQDIGEIKRGVEYDYLIKDENTLDFAVFNKGNLVLYSEFYNKELNCTKFFDKTYSKTSDFDLERILVSFL